MRLNQQHQPKSAAKAALAAFLLAMLLHNGVAVAVGLGGMNVLSRLGQPFAAEIDLINASRDDLATLKVYLASPAAYEAANLRFDPALNALRLSVERRANGTPYIRASSLRRVSEPYLDVLVELTAQDVKVQRAYTALLDLPDSPLPAAASAEPAPAAAAPKAQPVPPRTPAAPRAARPPAATDAPKVAAAAPAAAVPAVRAPTSAPVAGKTAPAPAEPRVAEPVRTEPAPVAVKPEPAVSEPPKEAAAKPEAMADAAKPTVPKPAAPPVPLPQQQAGIIDFVSNHAYAFGGAALALLAGIAALLARRRRSQAPASVQSTAAEVSPAQAPARAMAATGTLAAAAAAAPARATGAAVAEPEVPFEPLVASVTDVVDPLDEAKVHLEYGQAEQAERILREALSKQPGREDIQMQLLEIIASRGDKDGFNQLAGRVHRQTGGLGEHWKRVMAMGYALDPGYPLYSPTEGAGASGETAAEPAPEPLTGAADLPLGDDGPGIDMEKTMVLVRPGPAAASEDLPKIDFELPLAETPAAASAPPEDHPGLDFKVDLPGLDYKAEVAASPAATPAEGDSQWEEVQKKIMLARAYREMGDKEGALELLHEVEREGDSAQLAEMREILQTLK